MTIINESGLYALIFGSKLESAKKFKHWVTSEVLPALRKTGHYEIPGRSAYDTKATSVGEIVNLVRMQQKVMEKRGCSPEDISAMMDATFRQFGIQTPGIFLSAPGYKEIARFDGLASDEELAEYAEKLMGMGTLHKKKIYVAVADFNEFCARRSISARKFKRWLYQNEYIKCDRAKNGKFDYTATVWVNGGTKRCVVFEL